MFIKILCKHKPTPTTTWICPCIWYKLDNNALKLALFEITRELHDVDCSVTFYRVYSFVITFYCVIRMVATTLPINKRYVELFIQSCHSSKLFILVEGL